MEFAVSDKNPNTRAHSERAFEKNGLWERHQGPRQTRRFAECSLERVHVPWSEFSVLDVGCALGEALAVWRQKYPRAKLFGCDVAESAVERCRERYGDLAHFFRASFEEIEGFWDVIYCSNVLEHFEQYLEIADALLARCKVLLALTPFGELKDGSPMQPGRGDSFHAASFFRDSFDELAQRGRAARVESTILSCPGGGWGLTRLERIRWALGLLLRNRYIVQEPLEILYALHNPKFPGFSFIKDAGRYPL